MSSMHGHGLGTFFASFHVVHVGSRAFSTPFHVVYLIFHGPVHDLRASNACGSDLRAGKLFDFQMETTLHL